MYDATDVVSSAGGSVYVDGVGYAVSAAAAVGVAAYDDYAVFSDYGSVGSGTWAGVARVGGDDGVKG